MVINVKHTHNNHFKIIDHTVVIVDKLILIIIS